VKTLIDVGGAALWIGAWAGFGSWMAGSCPERIADAVFMNGWGVVMGACIWRRARA
jgi:hypothetical protein